MWQTQFLNHNLWLNSCHGSYFNNMNLKLCIIKDFVLNILLFRWIIKYQSPIFSLFTFMQYDVQIIIRKTKLTIFFLFMDMRTKQKIPCTHPKFSHAKHIYRTYRLKKKKSSCHEMVVCPWVTPKYFKIKFVFEKRIYQVELILGHW